MIGRTQHHASRRATLVIFLSVFGCACGLTDDRESKAREFMNQRVTSESQGILSLGRFTKTNGYDQEVQGTKMYVLEWQAEVTTRDDIWTAGNAIVGYWQTFAVMTQQPGQWDNLMAGGTSHIEKGLTVRLTGATKLRMTDNGWRPETLTVKTSELLPDLPKSGSNSPFVGVWRLGDQPIRISEMNSGRFNVEWGSFGADGSQSWPAAGQFYRLTNGKLEATSKDDWGIVAKQSFETDASNGLVYKVVQPSVTSGGPSRNRELKGTGIK